MPMRLFSRIIPALAAGLLSLSLVAGSSLADPTSDTQVELATALRPEEEVPAPGDPTASGAAYITLDRSQNQVCYDLYAQASTDVLGAHIHRGRPGENGPIVVGLATPPSGSDFVSGCTFADPEVIGDIAGDPAAYYVNIHTGAVPAGAARGQLGQVGRDNPAPVRPGGRPGPRGSQPGQGGSR